MEELSPPQPPVDTTTRKDRVAAFTAGTKILGHATRAIQAGRPEHELQESAQPGATPLSAEIMQGATTERVQQELSDDRTLHEMESQFDEK